MSDNDRRNDDKRVPTRPAPTAAPAMLSPAWEKLRILAPLLQTSVTLVVGGVLAWVLTGRVAAAIQQRPLEPSNVTEMREAIARLLTVDDTPEAAYADALALAAFRDHAIIPLILVVERGDFHAEAGKTGLRTVAITDSLDVAERLMRVVRDRRRTYSWRTHHAAIQLLGELSWRPARPLLEAYHRELATGTPDSSRARLTRWTSGAAPPLDRDVQAVRGSLQVALQSIPDRRP